MEGPSKKDPPPSGLALGFEDFHGRRWKEAVISRLNQEIKFMEEELKELDGLAPASTTWSYRKLKLPQILSFLLPELL
ncbi:uncharacterized protein LOC18440846 isoform X2 [Amborella trichopoda]|uniref:uncharacterized protein LOC18440846 isoform X2 n=1 Tax=Amborella trichopoda TaxID=13333 RepID=UPI0009BF0643|nr:uncharacterized protein LOC18440846 isoform X2 [Amborella trichopoda]|eukprot:XP_020526791.1 uncharacterized protein LOC18440846 isoform X2 [Amborella trichopoda]